MANKRVVYSSNEARELRQNWLEDSCDESDSELEDSEDSDESLSEEEIPISTGISAPGMENDVGDTANNNDLVASVRDHQVIAIHVPTADVSSTLPQKHPSKKATVPKSTNDYQLPMAWNLLGENDITQDQSPYNFRFCPPTDSGIIANNIDDNSTVSDCFFELFDMEIQDNLVNMINIFADMKFALNPTAKQYSLYSSWKPVEKFHLIKFISIIIATGLDKRPEIKDYWSTNDRLATPWYNDLFPRRRFEAIYQCFTLLQKMMLPQKGRLNHL